jgi:hypothetical protein
LARFLSLLLLFFSLSSLSGEEIGEQALYLSYKEIPKNVIKGSVSKVTLKVISVEKSFIDIEYKFAPSDDVTILNSEPTRAIDGNYIYDTFYFVAKADDIVFPKITASLVTNNYNFFAPTSLDGFSLKTTPLAKNSDFSNIIASSFDITDYKTSSFDNQSNIIVFSAIAEGCDISALKLRGVQKQGIESIEESYLNSKITYYGVIDKSVSTLTFSYFNLKKNSFININIPILVVDDSVVTQSDITPIDQSHQKFKLYVSIAIALFALVVFLLRRRVMYLLLGLGFGAYAIYSLTQGYEVCVKSGTSVYLLPMSHGTIFEKITQDQVLQKIGSRGSWSKVQLPSNKIGWIKDEDNCQN